RRGVGRSRGTRPHHRAREEFAEFAGGGGRARGGALRPGGRGGVDRSHEVHGLRGRGNPPVRRQQPADELGLRADERPGLLGRAGRRRGRPAHRPSPVLARASALGSALAVGMFLTTLSFLVTTPGVWEPSLGGFPALSALPGQFLIKDLALLGISLWSLGEAWQASQRKRSYNGATLHE